MTYEVTIGSSTFEVDVRSASAGGWIVSIDGGTEVEVRGGALGDGEWRLASERFEETLGMALRGDRFMTQLHGASWMGEVCDPRRMGFDLSAGAGKGQVSTSMPGAVVRIMVKEGQEVLEGAPLVVVEAMKMENEFRAPCDGVVQTIHVTPGATVEADALLVTLTPRDAE